MDNILDEQEIDLIPLEKTFVRIMTNVGKWCAYLSFIIGTMIFIAYVLTPDKNKYINIDFVVVVGMGYLAGAFIINFLVFALLLGSITVARYKRNVAKILGLMLANIPVSALYFFIVVSASK